MKVLTGCDSHRTNSYARTRLWLGICGVGSIVSLCGISLAFKLPTELLPTNQSWTLRDFTSLFALLGFYAVFMAPFDFVGGYLIPNRFGRTNLLPKDYFWLWFRGVTMQTAAYLAVILGLLSCGRTFGVLGCLAFVLLACATLLIGQSAISRLISGRQALRLEFETNGISALLAKWQVNPLPISVVGNSDPGFTGGVVGLPYFETVVIGQSWPALLSSEELAAMLARRFVAVSSGARARGLTIAMVWIVIGLAMSTCLPFAGVSSVAELVTTLAGFTLWTFIGLLILPTVSRQAAYVIDRLVVAQGISESSLNSALAKLDRQQDDEASRPAIVETIFHPVPSLTNRASSTINGRLAAWHVARTTLFLSWCCAGLLSRAVHCNVGRPELWIMLPTD